MPTFAQLLAEGFAVVAITALLTAFIAFTCAIAIDPIRPLGDTGHDVATRFFTPANKKEKPHENQHRTDEYQTYFPPPLPGTEARRKYHHRDPGQEYLEHNLQDLLDDLRDPHSAGRTR